MSHYKSKSTGGFLAILLLSGSLCTHVVQARSDDSTQSINIQANSAEINDATGVSTYRGDVEIAQGSMRLTGDLVLLNTRNKKVQQITAEGDLSTFQQTTDDGRIIHAEARKMVYNLSGNKIVLTDNAKLTESGNTFASDRIIFFTDREIVEAGSTSGNDRVNITVFPETVDRKNPAEDTEASPENEYDGT